MIIQPSLTPYVIRKCFSNWRSIKKNVEQRFYTYAVKKMSEWYYIECHAAPPNGEEDDVDIIGPITPQTDDNIKVVKYSLYLL